MHGLGNDFLIFDARKTPFLLQGDEIQSICQRHFGIGCDQMIVLEHSETADVMMRIFNADGSEAGGCGNATRCVAWLIGVENEKNEVKVETRSRSLVCTIGQDNAVRVDMGVPEFDAESCTISDKEELSKEIQGMLLLLYTDVADSLSDADVQNDSSRAYDAVDLPPKKEFEVTQTAIMAASCSKKQVMFVDIGNPHCTFFFYKDDIIPDPQDPNIMNEFTNEDQLKEYQQSYRDFSLIRDIEDGAISEIGMAVGGLEVFFPSGVNVGFCYVKDRNNVEVRVYERGVGETLACGTGVTAAVINGIKLGLLSPKVSVKVMGSVYTDQALTVEWSGDLKKSAFMSGPVSFVGKVEVDPDTILA